MDGVHGPRHIFPCSGSGANRALVSAGVGQSRRTNGLELAPAWPSVRWSSSPSDIYVRKKKCTLSSSHLRIVVRRPVDPPLAHENCPLYLLASFQSLPSPLPLTLLRSRPKSRRALLNTFQGSSLAGCCRPGRRPPPHEVDIINLFPSRECNVLVCGRTFPHQQEARRRRSHWRPTALAPRPPGIPGTHASEQLQLQAYCIPLTA